MRVVTSPGMFTESSPLPPSLLVPGKLMTWLGTVMGFEEKRGLPGQCDTPCQRIPGVDPVLEQSKVPSTRPNRPVTSSTLWYVLSPLLFIITDTRVTRRHYTLGCRLISQQFIRHDSLPSSNRRAVLGHVVSDHCLPSWVGYQFPELRREEEQVLLLQLRGGGVDGTEVSQLIQVQGQEKSPCTSPLTLRGQSTVKI